MQGSALVKSKTLPQCYAIYFSYQNVCDRARIELLSVVLVYPGTLGLSGILHRQWSSLDLKVSMLQFCIFPICCGVLLNSVGLCTMKIVLKRFYSLRNCSVQTLIFCIVIYVIDAQVLNAIITIYSFTDEIMTTRCSK